MPSSPCHSGRAHLDIASSWEDGVPKIIRERIEWCDKHVEENTPEQSADGVHFKQEAKEAQGRQVAKFIGEALAGLPSDK